MQLFIFNQQEQLAAVLKENIKDPIWLEKINAENTLNFSYPAADSLASFLTEGNLVSFKDSDGNFQLFEITKVNETHNSDGLMKNCHCEHSFYELNDDWIEDRRPTDATAEYALSQALLNTRWSVGTVDVGGTNSIIFYQQSALKSIHEIIEKWGGEIRPRVVISGNSITYRYLDLFQTRGNVTKKRFEYRHDLKNIEREVDLSETKTALYGFGRGEETDTGGFGRRTNFNDIVWTKPPNPADKPAGQKWVEDVDAKALWGRPFEGTVRNRFGDFIDADETDPATLLQKTWDELQKRNTPRISYSLDVIDLEKLSGYAHDAVRLGDTVVIIDREFANPIEITARVIELQRHLTDPIQAKVILANFFPDAAGYFSRLKDLESSYQSWEALGRAVFKTTWLDGKINVLSNQIQTNDGKVSITDDNGILIENADQTKALKLLGGILAISNEKIADEYQWRTFGTGDGFVCDELLSGTITAQTISLKSDGETPAIIKSDNYVAGESGWIIKSDGNAEFTSGIISGTVKIGTSTDYFRAFSNIYVSSLELYLDSKCCVRLCASAAEPHALLFFHPTTGANMADIQGGTNMNFNLYTAGGIFNFDGGDIVGSHPAYLKSPVDGYKMLRDYNKGFTTSASPGISASWIYTYPEAFASATGLSIVAIVSNTAQPICVTISGKTTTSCTLYLHRTDGANLSASTTYRCDILLVGP